MFSKVLVLIMGLSFSWISLAGVHDFSSVLEENEKIQKELTQKLQKQLETRDLGKAHKPDFHRVGEEVVGRGGENVAVETPEKAKSEKAQSLDVEKKTFKRLSQEFKQAK